jgi:hypothetical protein
MYVVHVKRVTPSQARREWFRLLDDVLSGEVVVLERKGQRIVLRKESGRGGASPPDYSKLIRVPGDDDADRWKWTWSPRGRLKLKERKKR